MYSALSQAKDGKTLLPQQQLLQTADYVSVCIDGCSMPYQPQTDKQGGKIACPKHSQLLWAAHIALNFYYFLKSDIYG